MGGTFLKRRQNDLAISPHIKRKVANFRQFHKMTLPSTENSLSVQPVKPGVVIHASVPSVTTSLKPLRNGMPSIANRASLMLRKKSSNKFSEFHELLSEEGRRRGRSHKKKSIAVSTFQNQVLQDSLVIDGSGSESEGPVNRKFYMKNRDHLKLKALP